LQRFSIAEIPFKARFGVWGSWFGIAIAILCLVAQFYVALFPIYDEPNILHFFEHYVAFPVIVGMFLFWKLYKKTRWIRLVEFDLVSGRRDVDADELKAENASAEDLSVWKRYARSKMIADLFRIYSWLC
jgi:yeast amino acid transporter